MKVLLTGATGFIGHALALQLAGQPDSFAVRAALRRQQDAPAVSSGIEPFVAGDLCDEDPLRWRQAAADCDAVVHAAARVHRPRELSAADALVQFRRVNTTATLRLARTCAAAGVRRFVFLSSTKVNGEATLPGQRFRADDPPRPGDPYAVSKLEAELGLKAIAAESGLEVVIVRPPLVYGPGAKANFAALQSAVARGVPLPLASIENRRSLLALDNLVDFIGVCLRHPAAAEQTFLPSDGEDVSTPELVRRVAQALARPVRLMRVPVPLLIAAATLLGRRAAVQRLCGNLQIDSSDACRRLGWLPPIGVNEGLRRAVTHLQSQ